MGTVISCIKGCCESAENKKEEDTNDIEEQETRATFYVEKRPTLINELNDIKIHPSNYIIERSCLPSDVYDKLGYLGEGAFGVVVKVQNKYNKEVRAMKIIKKSKMDEDFNEDQLFAEISIMKSLDHPNVIKIFEFFQDQHHYYMITEFCSQGDLLDKIENLKVLNEQIVMNIMHQILLGVSYLHSRNIVHGDLKLENVLIDLVSINHKKSFKTSVRETKSEEMHSVLNNFIIKLIDFGCSRIFKGNKLTDVVGTAYYVAPEVLSNSYNEKCDIWSCGVIMYMLLSGKPPFDGETEEEIFKSVKNGRFLFDSESFDKVSDSAKDLIRKLLTYNYATRISAKDALNHPWFKEANNNLLKDVKGVNSQLVLENLKSRNINRKFQQAVITFITHNSGLKDEVQRLKKLFQFIDKNNDGKLSKEELFSAYSELGSSIDEMELNRIYDALDTDHSGFIEYEEFLRASVDQKKLLTENNLKMAFDLFDIDRSGTITVEELKKILCGGKNIPDSVIKEILQEINRKDIDEINYEDFKQIMNNIMN